MKITFEGTFHDMLDQMEVMLNVFRGRNKPAPEVLPARGPTTTPFEVPRVVDKPVDTLVGTPVNKPGRTEKQKANDERLRERALAKKAAGLKVGDKTPKASAPPPPMEVPPAEPVDPVEVVNIRNKTITDLQEAYANGHQQEVFELLSRFGNGAKSFRELPPEAFLPISQAIAKGALT